MNRRLTVQNKYLNLQKMHSSNVAAMQVCLGMRSLAFCRRLRSPARDGQSPVGA